MPAAPAVRAHQGLYQPPLPWTDPSLPAADRAEPASRGPATSAKGRRGTTVGRARSPRPPVARRSSPYGGEGWYLDERTRRAGRQGVAAARAALAGVGGPGNGQQADAA